MNASIISIGNELLSGRTVDTNAAWLAAEILALDIPVVSTYIVGDEVDRIVRMLEAACRDANIVLVTGGLGPTEDDLTRDALAAFVCTELEFHQGLLDDIAGFFAVRGRAMAATNRRQAYLPAGARALANTTGTAPGIAVEQEGRRIYVMPGVPSEMKQMFTDGIKPALKRLDPGQHIVVRKLQCYGTGESDIAQIVGPLMARGRNPLINSTASQGVITMHIVARASSKPAALDLAQKDERLLREMLGSVVFGVEDQSLAQVVGGALAERKMTVATAESCTGGLLAKLITDVPGASRYYLQSWITYSNQAKTALLGVPAALIAADGAVSRRVAEAMASGARKAAGADYAIAITGIAGPDGGSSEKPPGLVYIALAADGRLYCQRCEFGQPRAAVRLRAAMTALDILRRQLAG